MALRKESPPRVGAVRPSQLTFSHGVGSLVDLPNFTVVVSGLDAWRQDDQAVIPEERLLAAVAATDGLGKVAELRAAPWIEETNNPFEEWARTGVPVYPFPRWLRCTRCNMLARIDSGLFERKANPYRPDLTRYVHKGCQMKGKPPLAIPARFVTACEDGHLDEFPWVEFCHKTVGACSGKPMLRMNEIGSGTRSTEVQIECRTCGAKMHMSQAFGEPGKRTMPGCRGRHPHMRWFDPEGCANQVRALLLGASNAWFADTKRALSIPRTSDPMEQLVDEVWDVLDDVGDRSDLDGAVKWNETLKKRLGGTDLDAVWRAVEARRAAGADPDDVLDLHRPEWETLTDPQSAQSLFSADFRVESVAVPAQFGGRIEAVVLAHRLREVVALCGFTRIEGPDSGVADDVTARRSAPLTLEPRWVPATEVRGEGIFVQLPEDAVDSWTGRVAGTPRIEALRASYQRWRKRRGLDPAVGWKGERYLLLHSLAHALVNAVALECGYGAASIRERIYCEEPGGERPPMAGILLYTSAPDSEGTLGGLVSLGRPERFGRILAQALDRCRLCSSDPHCGEHCPTDTEESLHLGACHACLFVPETSCDSGNRYLDRALLVDTIGGDHLEYFA